MSTNYPFFTHLARKVKFGVAANVEVSGGAAPVGQETFFEDHCRISVRLTAWLSGAFTL